MLKKVKDLTVEELINLGKQDNVRNLEITIDGSNHTNKHFDVKIGGVGYGRTLFLEDEIEVPNKERQLLDPLSYVLTYRMHYTYGKVAFVDKNDVAIQTTDVDKLTNISTRFYDLLVEYEELLPTDNSYRDEIVARIKFVDHTMAQLIEIKNKNN